MRATSRMKPLTMIVSIIMALLSVSVLNIHTVKDYGGVTSRAQWLRNVAEQAAFIMTTSSVIATPPASAKDDPSTKGTKQDPAFEACLSQCMYECTKPKGAEQKSRKECLPECKQLCATTKAQLLLGVPIKSS